MDAQSTTTTTIDFDYSTGEVPDGELPPELRDHPLPELIELCDMQEKYGQLRQPIIDGMVRRRDVANVIASSKTGKSWLSLGMAYSVATGREWLGLPVTQGSVLIIDNELDPTDVSWRLRVVAEAMEIDFDSVYGTSLFVDSRRYLPCNLLHMGPYFDELVELDLSLVIFDALYRFYPPRFIENDNGQMASIYNQLNRYAAQIDAAIISVHHATKGDQSAKQVTDMGAGGGSQSRAADAHIILRPHALEELAVMDAVVRTFPRLEPISLQWKFPIWEHKPEIEPELRQVKSTGDSKQEARDREAIAAIEEAIGKGKISQNKLREQTGLSYDRLNRLLAMLRTEKRVIETEEPDDKKKTRFFELSAPTDSSSHG